MRGAPAIHECSGRAVSDAPRTGLPLLPTPCSRPALACALWSSAASRSPSFFAARDAKSSTVVSFFVRSRKKSRMPIATAVGPPRPWLNNSEIDGAKLRRLQKLTLATCLTSLSGKRNRFPQLWFLTHCASCLGTARRPPESSPGHRSSPRALSRPYKSRSAHAASETPLSPPPQSAATSAHRYASSRTTLMALHPLTPPRPRAPLPSPRHRPCASPGKPSGRHPDPPSSAWPPSPDSERGGGSRQTAAGRGAAGHSRPAAREKSTHAAHKCGDRGQQRRGGHLGLLLLLLLLDDPLPLVRRRGLLLGGRRRSLRQHEVGNRVGG